MLPSEFGQKRKFRLSALTVSKSAEADLGSVASLGRQCAGYLPLSPPSSWTAAS